MKIIFILVILFAIVVHQGSALLKCYQCTSESSLGRKDPCYDPRSSSGIEPSICSEEVLFNIINFIIRTKEQVIPVCMKADIKVGMETITKRDCGVVLKNDLKDTQISCNRLTRGTGGILQYCGICEEDGCNLAPGNQATTFITLIIFSALIRLI